MMEREVKKYCLQNKQLLGKINGSLGDQMRATKACDKVCVGVVPAPRVRVPLPWLGTPREGIHSCEALFYGGPACRQIQVIQRKPSPAFVDF